MANLKQFGFQLSAHTDPNRCFSKASLRTVGCALVVLGIMLPWLGIATAQQEPSSLQKQVLEVAKLKKDSDEVPKWFTIVSVFLAGVASAGATVFVARRARHGALDQSVHDKRLDSYPKLVVATARLALYFPSDDPPDPSSDPSAASIGPKDCSAMGQAMTAWYFGGGGLLLTVEARDAYFRLARALTLASLAKKLRVPMFPKDAKDISVEKVKEYRANLARKLKLKLDDIKLDVIENWSFGDPGSEEDNSVVRFKDFIFLQQLSSDLRTKLSEDLRSRRRPNGRRFRTWIRTWIQKTMVVFTSLWPRSS